jgi:hypothetical protein
VHSAALPSIGFLETEKIKREEAEYQRRNAAAAMVSPSFPYSCPPPPYSHPPTANAAHPPPSGLISPPESRRTSGDEPAPVQSTRQSLPSIHEALGGSDPALPSYPPQTAAPPTSAPAFYPPPNTGSMTDLHRRSFTSGPPPPAQEPHHPYSQPSPHSPFTSRTPQAMHAPHTPSSTADILSRPPLYAPQQHPKLPTLQPIRTGNSPVTSLRPSLAYQPQQSSPAYDSHPASQSAPATAQYGSGFSQFPPSSFSFNPPTPGSTYPGTAPPRYPPGPPTWRQDSAARSEDRQQDNRMGGMPPLPYGESVKRHLDNFDLEASLNEVRYTI